MSVSLGSVLPYLLVIGGYVLRHYDVASKLLKLAGLPPLHTPTPAPSADPAGGTVLSDAAKAAIDKAVADVTAGHVSSFRDELIAVAKAAVEKAVADIKAKV